MNPALLSTSASLASSLWTKFKDFRDEKAREAYDALEAAAARVEDRVDDFESDVLPEARREAGAVTKAAHDRLERALKEIKNYGEEAKDEATKRSKAARKKARKESKKINKRVEKKLAKATGKKKSRKFWPIAAIVALVATVGTAVYYFFFRKEEPSEVPPRVEDFGANSATEGSTLVYTSTTEDDLKESDLAEEGVVERDEELLNSIDEQLAQHRAEDTSRITDDREDEGKHRLHTEEEK
ncbi:hypothetical protein [Corynebacterium sp.]|uniref:hypothetical protein n=1 Tax=Corynebacterium sp. TaxID=1720 RepID=UPI0026DD1C16|nr:hypothetical protein [Corynebacterium sp.]MDO5032162.1 hypothetical protein [Corynebacterium sp.]